jgi:ligand-binding sensor domain-containing protein/two-component sensor histidine kinase
MIKDNRGFLWIGTADGLNRYDGKNFVHYFHSIYNTNSIPNNSVQSLFQVNNGEIWIGTFNGLCRLNPLNNVITRIPFPEYLKNTEIISAADIKQNPEDASIWIASNKGLFYFDAKKDQILPASDNLSYLKNQFITAIHIPSKDEMWLASYDGLIKYNSKQGTTQVFRPSSSTELKGTLITSIHADEDGLLWLGTWGRGMQCFDPSTEKFTRYLNRPDLGERSDANIIHSISKSNLPSEKDVLWVAADSYYAFNKTTKQFISFASQDNENRFGVFGECLSFCNGREEGMWIGGTNGLYRQDPHHQLFDHISLNIPRNKHCLSDIFTVYADPIDSSGNTFFVGTWSCGIFTLNAKEGTSAQLPAWMLRAIGKTGYFKTFHRDRSGGLWATTSENGLHFFDEKKKQIKSYLPQTNRRLEKSGNLGSIVEDDEGNFWIGSIQGIYYFDRKTEIITPVFYSGFNAASNVSDEIKSMEMDQKGNLWFCTNLGVYKKPVIGRIPAGGNKPDLFYVHDEKKPNSFPERSPLEGIAIDKKNNIWCATWNGLIYWNADDSIPTFNRLTREDGLSNDKIHKVQTDQFNRVWMATIMGLSCYDPATRRFRNFYTAQGLHKDEIRSLFKNGVTGQLIAAYHGGLDLFDPAALPTAGKPPATVITGLKLFNEPYSQNKKFFIDRGTASLSPSQNMLTISFSALSFTDPDQIKYAYKMEGIDKDWIMSENDFATYHNLSPGTRMFNVKARNADGTWDQEGTWMLIELAPPFYKAWWFITLLVIAIAAGAYGLYYIRISRLKEKFRIRSTIARDLHDEIGSTLTSINILSRVSYTNLEKDKARASDLIQKITEQSESMQQSMSDIIWAIKPENDKLRNMTARMREYLSHTLESRNIAISFTAEENVMEESLSMEQRRDFFLIFKEAVNNAAKYSQSNQVWVEIKKSGANILLRIRDDGRGFFVNGALSTNGLKNMRARAASLKARLNITSAPGKGTTIQLILPAT